LTANHKPLLGFVGWFLLLVALAGWGLREREWSRRLGRVQTPVDARQAVVRTQAAATAPATSPDETDGSASSATRPAGKEVVRIPFESFATVDWGTGRPFQLPLLNPSDPRSFAFANNDGGDWSAQAFLVSDDSRSGKSFQIQIRNPVRMGGGGVDFCLHKETALAAGKRHTATVWAKSDFSAADHDYSDVVLGWIPGPTDNSRVQDYREYSRQTNVAGWRRLSLSFVANTNRNAGDRILIAFAAKSQKLALNAVFDDLVITQDEP
jgi:hypothetical protein